MLGYPPQFGYRPSTRKVSRYSAKSPWDGMTRRDFFGFAIGRVKVITIPNSARFTRVTDNFPLIALVFVVFDGNKPTLFLSVKNDRRFGRSQNITANLNSNHQ